MTGSLFQSTCFEPSTIVFQCSENNANNILQEAHTRRRVFILLDQGVASRRSCCSEVSDCCCIVFRTSNYCLQHVYLCRRESKCYHQLPPVLDNNSQHKHVHFSYVTVREYEIRPSDTPAVSSGAGIEVCSYDNHYSCSERLTNSSILSSGGTTKFCWRQLH